MDQAKANAAFAATLVDQLAASGLTDVCISPGSRSAPLAIAFFRHPGIRAWIHVDERSGSFFGLGLARASGRPVALVCTSGTAAAEFHPAVLEAAHGRVPLLVLTADRPPELLDVGANQAITQSRIYGPAVRWFADPGPPAAEADAARVRSLAARAMAEAAGPMPGPVHLNLAFREPLLPDPTQPWPAVPGTAPSVAATMAAPSAAAIELLAEALGKAEQPVLVAGGMAGGAALRDAALGLGVPVLAEPASGLRAVEVPYEAMLRSRAWAKAHTPDLVVRVGATPTSKPLNQWLATSGARTLLIDPAGGWADPDRAATDVIRADPQLLLSAAGRSPAGGWADAWTAAAGTAAAAVAQALAGLPLFEAQGVRALAAGLPAAADIMLGSSMPVRAADVFWPAAPASQRFFGNRGASGIDGLVSTGAGIAAGGRPTAILLGDLSLFHDSNGLAAFGRHRLPATLLVFDNGGGGIFGFLPQAGYEQEFEELFLTPVKVRPEELARLHGIPVTAVSEAGELSDALAAAQPGMVVARFPLGQSVAGHRAVWSAVDAALSR